jgi:hypothetical protein
VDPVRRIADAVLYEGYILWPYRKSAIKNRQRFGTFGGVYPRGRDDPSSMQTQCLVESAGHAVVDVRVRFLHVVDRQVLDAAGAPVDELELGDERHVSWQEAAEREFATEGLPLGSARRMDIRVPAGEEREELAGGALVRRWRELAGAIDVYAEQLRPALFRLTVRIDNLTPWGDADRERALLRTFCSTHAVLTVSGGGFVSLTDPPAALGADAEACENVGTWPVLAGAPGDRSTVLSSPIILPDHPQIAPESPGDLFDATEIDQMLVLNILSLTEEEKREMRDSDPRAREILERTEALTEDELMRLHGAIREFGLVRHP